MLFRRRSGVRGRPRARTRAVAAALIALAAVAWTGRTGASQAERALDHQAVVLNGRVVGSTFLIAPDVALTNAHVVEGLSPGATVTLVKADRTTTAPAEVLAISPYMDLAVLRAPLGFLPVVSEDDAPRRFGMPVQGAGVDASGGKGLGPRLELDGAVLSLETNLGAYGPGLIVSLPGVKPGFSGGPVLDGDGRLVGMITAIRAGSPRVGALAAAGSGSSRTRAPDEAFVLRASEIRREARRLLSSRLD